MAREPDIFASSVVRMDSGVVTHIVTVPPEIAERYVEAGERRVIVLLNGHEVRRYLFQSANGEFGVIVGRSLLRDIGVALNEPVIVEMTPDPEPDRVDICDELVAALEQDEEAAERFYNWTPGKQRGLALYVAQAKRSETRVKRALEVTYKLRTYTLYGDRKE